MSILQPIHQSIAQSELVYCKFITANDTGSTGAHQSGFHIHKLAWPLLFESEGVRGENMDKLVTIRWQDSFDTESRFIYYGVRTRNEYRITRFGRGFPFLRDVFEGSLLILCKLLDGGFKGYVVESDEEIDDFFNNGQISFSDINSIVRPNNRQRTESLILQCFQSFISQVASGFPQSTVVADAARNCYNSAHSIDVGRIMQSPDNIISAWLAAEFELFRALEIREYQPYLQSLFPDVESLITVANTILNRRKSRAGKSLEHHLMAIFDAFQLRFASQANTEENKKPDFLFPGTSEYQSSQDSSGLFMLACKTTCKDRWRQILNEADRIPSKHLFTLQAGISQNQLDEMYRSGVCLVVPQANLTTYSERYRSRILTLNGFVNLVKASQQGS